MERMAGGKESLAAWREKHYSVDMSARKMAHVCRRKAQVEGKRTRIGLDATEEAYSIRVATLVPSCSS